MKIASFKTNTKLEIAGVWKVIAPDTELLVARDNNPNFVKELRLAMAPYSTKIQRSNMTNELAEDILSKIMSTTILLGWKNIQDDDGNQIEYSPEAAYDLFKKYPEFKSLVMTIAGDLDNYRESGLDEVKEDLKKS